MNVVFHVFFHAMPPMVVKDKYMTLSLERRNFIEKRTKVIEGQQNGTGIH